MQRSAFPLRRGAFLDRRGASFVQRSAFFIQRGTSLLVQTRFRVPIRTTLCKSRHLMCTILGRERPFGCARHPPCAVRHAVGRSFTADVNRWRHNLRAIPEASSTDSWPRVIMLSERAILHDVACVAIGACAALKRSRQELARRVLCLLITRRCPRRLETVL